MNKLTPSPGLYDLTTPALNLEISPREFKSALRHLESVFATITPELKLTVRDPDLGLLGYVVVFNTLASIGGPLGRCGKGGTRISTSVNAKEVEMLAKSMTLKNAAAGLPLGGAKSAIKADPNAKDFERKYRRFVRLVQPYLVENGGIFGGFGFDVGASPDHALWACSELNSRRCFTGKPLDMGGTDYDKEGIAGLGVATAAKTAIEFAGKSISSATAAVQGLGAMGSAVVRYFTEFGGGVTSIGDPSIGGTYLFPTGLPADIRDCIVGHDLTAAKRLIAERGFAQAELDAVLYQPVGVTFPCAFQKVITPANVDRIISPFVVEGANNPSSKSAQTRLFERRITVVPDFIANPGGIIAAFVEMTSTISPEENARTRKNVIDAKALTQSKIAKNVGDLLNLAKRLKIPPARVGRFMAISRILKQG
jgi:glutamate dehydrogenase (NAD(P)+)